MAKVDFSSPNPSSCGGNSITSFIIYINQVQVNQGSLLYPCGITDRAKWLIEQYSDYYNLLTDNIYFNNILYSSPGAHTACVSGVCTHVSGAGANECATLGQSCTPGAADSPIGILAGITIMAAIAYFTFKEKN